MLEIVQILMIRNTLELPTGQNIGPTDLEVVELERLGAVGVEVVSNNDDSGHHNNQQHQSNPHPRLVGHMHLLSQSQARSEGK